MVTEAIRSESKRIVFAGPEWTELVAVCGVLAIISTERLVAGVAADLRQARAARVYSLEDVAETCGLTVDEIKALEAAQDMDSRKLARVAAAVGLPHSPSSQR